MNVPRINSDSAFREVLASLSLANQRRVGKLFIDHVMELTESSKVKKAMASVSAVEPSEEGEITDAYNLAKSAAIESYTLCGSEGDWRKQSGHFVAAAAVSCLTPEPRLVRGGDLAWSTAMNARMARVCEKIAEGTEGKGADNKEAEEQYHILESFLKRD